MTPSPIAIAIAIARATLRRDPCAHERSGEATCPTRVCEGSELGAAAHCALGPGEFGGLCGLLGRP